MIHWPSVSQEVALISKENFPIEIEGSNEQEFKTGNTKSCILSA